VVKVTPQQPWQWFCANSVGTSETEIFAACSTAWTVIPVHGRLENAGMEQGATFFWTSVLLIPLGYWTVALARQMKRAAALSLIAVLAALLAAGLILVPAAFALRGATPLDWIDAVSGVGIGAALTLLINGNKKQDPRERLDAC
jgi:hypothetical protein